MDRIVQWQQIRTLLVIGADSQALVHFSSIPLSPARLEPPGAARNGSLVAMGSRLRSLGAAHR